MEPAMISDTDNRTDEKVSCFVICPIGDKDADGDTPERVVWENSWEVFEEVILPACEAFGIEPLRADQISEAGEIPEQVCRHLREDNIVIADLTGGNPNVMYELGLRHTTGKVTIQIGEKGKLPFDVAAIRTTMFLRTQNRLVQARKQLTEMLSGALRGKYSHATATRVWLAGQATQALADCEGDIADEEPGYLEKLVDVEEHLVKLPEYMTEVTRLMSEMNEKTADASRKTEKANKTGAPASARLAIANALANKLEPYAEQLQQTAESFYFAVQKVDPGVRHLLAIPLSGPEKAELQKFRESVGVSLESTETYAASAMRLRETLGGTGEITRSLRQVTGKTRRGLDKLIEASRQMLRWKDFLQERS